jgi:excisionase family DNA binding protein
MGMEIDELLTVEEVAQLLKVPRSWVYERTRTRGDDRLPFVKLGKYVRFEESQVWEYVRRQHRGAPLPVRQE